jgi:hypothetical protein
VEGQQPAEGLVPGEAEPGEARAHDEGLDQALDRPGRAHQQEGVGGVGGALAREEGGDEGEQGALAGITASTIARPLAEGWPRLASLRVGAM